MQMLRIVFAGALLFGSGCELPEEGGLTTDERIDPANLDDSTDYATETTDYGPNYGIDEGLALSSDVSGVSPGEIIDEEEFDVALSEDELLGSQKWECTYCYKHECYHAKHKKKDKAKDKAEDKCEDDHHGKHCYFKECEKTD